MKDKGLTIVEVAISSIILSVIAGLLITAYMQGISIFQTADINSTLQGNARTAFNMLSLDLRKTSRNQIQIIQNNPFSGTDTIIYHLPRESAGMPVLTGDNTIDWNTSTITIGLDQIEPKRLVKDIDGVKAPITHNVKSIRFIDHTIDSALQLDELKVILNMEETGTAGKVYNLTYTCIINMRN